MRDDLSKDLLPSAGEKIDPVEMARRDQKKSLPKRFYKETGTAPHARGFAVTLDGREVKTPGRNPLVLPTQALAQRIADEWQAQGEWIDPHEMPMTRIANSALDGVAREMQAVADEIVKYSNSDLVCYRAGEPETLVKAQAGAWDRILLFGRETLGARFICAEGVMFVEQPAQAIEALADTLAEYVNGSNAAPFELAALSVMTTLTGSALIALAVAKGELSAEEGWQAAHVDEDFQIHAWGADDEATARRARRWTEMKAAADMLALIG